MPRRVSVGNLFLRIILAGLGSRAGIPVKPFYKTYSMGYFVTL